MPVQWQIFIGHLVFFGSALVTLSIVVIFRVLDARQRRRSPLYGKQVGNLPGQQLLKRIDDLDREISYGLDIMMLGLPMMFMIWATLKIDWTRVRFGVPEAMFIIGWAAMLLHGFWVYRRHYRGRQQARDGLLAERVTGIQLNRLVASGCVVMHDLPADGFNIDHIVVAPRGVYAVETKSFRKPKAQGAESSQVMFDGKTLRFPDFMNVDAVDQALRQARWLAREVRETLGKDVPVTAALSLPGWYVKQDDGVWHGAAVKVFTPMGDGCNFMAKGRDVLDASQRSLIAKALALRYPRIDS